MGFISGVHDNEKSSENGYLQEFVSTQCPPYMPPKVVEGPMIETCQDLSYKGEQ